MQGALPIRFRRLGLRESIPGPVYLVHREMVPAQRELVATYLAERGGVQPYNPAAYAALRSAMETALR